MEGKVKEALGKLPGDLAGEYFPLVGMTKETQDKLVADHFLFNDSDRYVYTVWLGFMVKIAN